MESSFCSSSMDWELSIIYKILIKVVGFCLSSSMCIFGSGSLLSVRSFLQVFRKLFRVRM